MSTLINATGHGLSAGSAFRFANVLPTDTGIDENEVYYVLATDLTADAFRFALTAGGTAITLASNITSGSLYNLQTYGLVSTGAMSPPTTPATPATPTLTSELVNGVVKLKVTL